ncbi:PstC family ABC transporter permease, partial [Pontiella sp.]|uniref:PstC family ABC transporter permease n=1 Tax=Pontiella sp. TaxID=2837462 RepID=UPI00356B285D
MNPHANKSLIMSDAASRRQRISTLAGQSFLFLVTSLSTFAVFFIFYFILKDAIPFFKLEGFKEFFTSARWYPSGSPAEFGALPIFVGTGLVTLGAVLVAVPLGISAAVCLSDLLPFQTRQIVKPVIEVLAAIPSVAYGFFALVVFAPLLQNHGGAILSAGVWIVLGPILALAVVVAGDLIIDKFRKLNAAPKTIGAVVFPILGILALALLYKLSASLSGVEISSGTNALNVSIILGIMALPT